MFSSDTEGSDQNSGTQYDSGQGKLSFKERRSLCE